MSPFVRGVETISGATVVQIVSESGGICRIAERLGLVHDEAGLEVLLETGWQKIAAWQGQGLLDPESLEPAPGRTGLATTTMEPRYSKLLWAVLHGAYQCLGLGETVGDDRAFKQMVLTRLVEPSSKAQVPWVLSDLGPKAVTVRTLFRSLARIQEQGCREGLLNALSKHVAASGSLVLCPYDATTLYFEAEREGNPRRMGHSKERRVDPQVIVGLLADRRGFPLRIGCWRDNKAETTTIIPIVEAFQAAYGTEELTVVVNTGMLSAANFTVLDDARLHSIVGARQVRALGNPEAYFHWTGGAFTDGQLIGTITPKRGSNTEWDKSLRVEPVWDPDTCPGSRRAVRTYSKKCAARNTQILTAQTSHVRVVIAGERRPKDTRFITAHRGDQVLDEASLARTRSLVGLKGYITNIPSCPTGAGEVVSSYHEPRHVKQSFRVSKHDLRAHPVFHHTRGAIEVYLTVVMAALAIVRRIQETTRINIKRIIRTLKSLQDVTTGLNGHKITAQPRIVPTVVNILKSLQSLGH